MRKVHYAVVRFIWCPVCDDLVKFKVFFIELTAKNYHSVVRASLSGALQPYVSSSMSFATPGRAGLWEILAVLVAGGARFATCLYSGAPWPPVRMESN